MNWNPISWFPFTQEGRKTLIYVAIMWACPVLTGAIMYALNTIRWFDAPALNRLTAYADIADKLSWGLLIVLISFACYVSIRAFNIDLKNGTVSTQSKDDEEETNA